MHPQPRAILRAIGGKPQPLFVGAAVADARTAGLSVPGQMAGDLLLGIVFGIDNNHGGPPSGWTTHYNATPSSQGRVVIASRTAATANETLGLWTEYYWSGRAALLAAWRQHGGIGAVQFDNTNNNTAPQWGSFTPQDASGASVLLRVALARPNNDTQNQDGMPDLTNTGGLTSIFNQYFWFDHGGWYGGGEGGSYYEPMVWDRRAVLLRHPGRAGFGTAINGTFASACRWHSFSIEVKPA